MNAKEENPKIILTSVTPFMKANALENQQINVKYDIYIHEIYGHSKI